MSAEAHDHLSKLSATYAGLGGLLEKNGVLELRSASERSFFEELVATVVGQQLSNKAASTIWGRVQDAAAQHKLSLYDYCVIDNLDELRACGVSGNKVKAIIGVRDAFAEKRINERALREASCQQIIDTISDLWGFGNWSAEMIAIFYFGHQDVWSTGDASLQKGIKILCKEDQNIERELLDSAAPYRSFLSLHIWAAMDNDYFG